ncbi:MAG TPA: 2OG-Fe(II) oxygenase [Pyrinomonadaceae bacterium]
MQEQTRTIPEFDLFIVKDFFDVKTCRAIVNDMRCSPFSAASTYGKGDATVDERVRRTSRASPSTETVLYVIRRLEEHRQRMERHFAVALGGCEEPQFLCYRTGDFFVAHQDGNTGLINLETDRTRRVSVSIFLNQQSAKERNENYCGGSLVFSDWRTGARHEVVGEAGMLVAFRSETTHEVMPVTYGERYAIASWYGRRVREGDD